MNEEKEVVKEETETEEVKEEKVEIEAEETAETEKEQQDSKEPKKIFKDSRKILQAEIEQLKGELAIARNDLANAQNAYYKAYADADNMKKRLLQDKEISDKYRVQSFVLDILPSIDALEMALKDKDLNDPFVKGVKLTYDSIMNALAKEGVTQIDCLNKEFDANLHHAMMTEAKEGVEPNTVIEVFQKGYMLKDRLLRAALVKVSE